MALAAGVFARAGAGVFATAEGMAGREAARLRDDGRCYEMRFSAPFGN